MELHADMHNILRQSEISLYWDEAIYIYMASLCFKAKDQSKRKFIENFEIDVAIVTSWKWKINANILVMNLIKVTASEFS